MPDAIDGKVEAQKTWGASPTGTTSAPGDQPGTREFFDKARAFRDGIEQPWLSDVVPFAASKGKRVLEIGFGPGYDTLKFMQAGAIYSGIDITPENVTRTKAHLGFFGLDPDVQQGDAEALPFDDATFDIVYSNGVLHHVPDMRKAFSEAHRVLKPGGEFCVLLYHRKSLHYGGIILLHLLRGNFLRETLAQRRSRIESTSADARPIVNVYSRRELSSILQAADFTVKSTDVRKCTPADLPGASVGLALYEKLPVKAYEWLGRHFGWYVIGRAIKK